MTPKEKSTLIKVGLGVGAAVWAGPQILAMLFALGFLALFAGVVFLAMVGTLLKYALLIAAGVGAVFVLGKLISGPSKPKARKPSFSAVERKKRLEKASLDLELAKAVASANANAKQQR